MCSEQGAGWEGEGQGSSQAQPRWPRQVLDFHTLQRILPVSQEAAWGMWGSQETKGSETKEGLKTTGLTQPDTV